MSSQKSKLRQNSFGRGGDKRGGTDEPQVCNSSPPSLFILQAITERWHRGEKEAVCMLVVVFHGFADHS